MRWLFELAVDASVPRTSTDTRRPSLPAGPTTYGPGHFVQTLEPVGLMEISPIDEHDCTIAIVAKNMRLVVS